MVTISTIIFRISKLLSTARLQEENGCINATLFTKCSPHIPTSLHAGGGGMDFLVKNKTECACFFKVQGGRRCSFSVTAQFVLIKSYTFSIGGGTHPTLQAPLGPSKTRVDFSSLFHDFLALPLAARVSDAKRKNVA
jgi:hypothetical protein